MSPIARILKAGKNTDSRIIADEFYQKETVVIKQQPLVDNNEWQTTNHMAITIVKFDYLQSFSLEKVVLKGSQYNLDIVTIYILEFIFDPMILDESVLKNLV